MQTLSHERGVRGGTSGLGALGRRAGALLRRVGPAPLLLAAVLAPLPQDGGTSIAGLPTLCPFRSLVGLPCPDCGMVRSLVCCGHGLWAEAAAFHPLGPGVFALLIAWTAIRLLPVRAPSFPRGVAWAGVALVLGVWAARLSGLLPALP